MKIYKELGIISLLTLLIFFLINIICLYRWYIPFFQSRLEFRSEIKNNKTIFYNDNFKIQFEVEGFCHIKSNLLNHIIDYGSHSWSGFIVCNKEKIISNLRITNYSDCKYDYYNSTDDKMVTKIMPLFKNYPRICGGMENNIFSAKIQQDNHKQTLFIDSTKKFSEMINNSIKTF